ncbi:helix-turn-helix domain-containing protein (plasmid) [Vagococcus sp. JNUCC 83]
MDIGLLLKNLRKKNNLTQEELAKHLFVSRQTVSRWEQNRTIPNIYVLEDISKFYGISLKELLTDQEGEKVMEHKKINIFGLLGVLIFNIYIILGPLIVVIAVTLSALFVSIIFLLCPIILVIVNIMGLQAFTWSQLGFSILLCVVGISMLFLAKKTAKPLFNIIKSYCRYNIKTILT